MDLFFHLETAHCSMEYCVYQTFDERAKKGKIMKNSVARLAVGYDKHQDIHMKSAENPDRQT